MVSWEDEFYCHTSNSIFRIGLIKVRLRGSLGHLDTVRGSAYSITPETINYCITDS